MGLFEKGKTHWQLCFTKITPPPAHQTIFCQKLSKTFFVAFVMVSECEGAQPCVKTKCSESSLMQSGNPWNCF